MSQKTSEIQVELSEEISQGTYANLVVVSHSNSEFIIDFIRVVPGAPKAKVMSRVILTPDNAKRLLYALQDNIRKFDDQMQGNGGLPFDGTLMSPLGGAPGQA